MALARYQFTATDDEGNVLPGASVTVRSELTGNPLAALFSNRAGNAAIGNPFNADADGFAAFHVIGGAYWVEVTSGAFTRSWRFVGVGLANESDGSALGFPFGFDLGVNDADPGVGLFRFNNTTPASATKVFISETTANAVSIAAFLATLNTKSRLLFQGAGGIGVLVATVSGTVTDDGAYYDIPITVVTATAADTFVQNAIFGFSVAQGGADGEVSTPAGSVAGNLSRFTDTTGNTMEDATKNINNVGAGKQTAWIPATAMKPRVAGPSLGSFVAGSTEFDYYAFDPASIEDLTFNIAMPKGWDEGNVSYLVYWMHPATTTNFATVWGMFAKAYSDDDAIDGASYAGLGNVTDTGGTTSDLYISAESTPAAVTGAAENDLVNFILRRQATDGADTMAVDAYFLGIKLFFTTNANTDA